MEVSLRNYKDSDYDSVRKNLEESDLIDTIRDTRERLKKKIQRDSGSIIVAEADGRVVGNILFIEDGWCAYLFRLAVTKEYRGKGLGERLTIEAEKRLRIRGVKKISLFANEKSPELIEYYRKQDYIPMDSYRYMYKEFKD